MLTTSNCLNNLQYNDLYVVYDWTSIIMQKSLLIVLSNTLIRVTCRTFSHRHDLYIYIYIYIYITSW